MLWDVNNPEHAAMIPLEVFDAVGVEYHYVTKCNTETGEIEFIQHNDKMIIEHFDGEPIRVKLTAPAPLELRPIAKAMSIVSFNQAVTEGKLCITCE